MIYALVTALALAILFLAYAQVSQPQTAALEHARAQSAEARIAPLQTEVARLRPTPRSCMSPPDFRNVC